MASNRRRKSVPLDHANEVEHRRLLAMRANASLSTGVPIPLEPYTVTTLPSASEWEYSMIYVSNESGGAIPAFSDGTNWRRMSDRAIVS